jgi:transcriptional regulator with XRE-family HTH domain
MKRTPLNIAFGAAVRKRRQELNLTQQELANRAGLQRGYVANVETGGCNTSLQNIVKLAGALQTSMSGLTAVMEGADPERLSTELIQIQYSFKILSAGLVVTDVDSSVELPLALNPEFLSTTGGDFGKIWNRLITRPIEDAVRGFLKRRIDALPVPIAEPVVAGPLKGLPGAIRSDTPKLPELPELPELAGSRETDETPEGK